MYRALLAASAVIDFIAAALSNASNKAYLTSLAAEDKAVEVRVTKADAKLDAAEDLVRKAALDLARAKSSLEDATNAWRDEYAEVKAKHGYVI